MQNYLYEVALEKLAAAEEPKKKPSFLKRHGKKILGAGALTAAGYYAAKDYGKYKKLTPNLDFAKRRLSMADLPSEKARYRGAVKKHLDRVNATLTGKAVAGASRLKSSFKEMSDKAKADIDRMNRGY